MSSKRKFSNVEINESSANIANNLRDICDSDSSDSSDFLFPVIKHCKQLIIRDDTDDEEHNNHQRNGFGKKKIIYQKSGII